MKTRAHFFILVLAALACRDHAGPTAPPLALSISDGARAGGNPHFYWLPPMVPAPSPTGTFDPSSSPVVRISEWTGGEGALVAQYSMSSGPGSETVRLLLQDEAYAVDWKTGEFALNPAINYRIRVLVGGIELGFADVDVVSNNGDLKRVDKDHIGLRNGLSLSIRFRIEQGATPPTRLTLIKHVVNDNGGTSVASDFALTASGPTPISGAGGVSSGSGFTAGTYTLSETGPAGYRASAWICTGGTQSGNQITVTAAQTAVCEITNDDVTPSSVRLQSDVGDYIGAGQSYQYTKANAVITVTASGGRLSVGIRGDQQWFGDFQSPNTLNRLEPGTYTGLSRYPFHNPATGGLNWSGEGRGCNTLTGSFTVERVTYLDNNLTAIDLTFEQHCEGAAPALRGEIHWSADDATQPPGPIYPVPAGLWEPAAGSTPSTGNFVYLNSEPGDYIGQGQVYTYTSQNATINLAPNGGRLSVGINGWQWNGDFQAMNTLSQLQPGYYPDLKRYPFHNPAKGGLNWSGEGRGCNTLEGWFVIDRVVYTNGSLTSLDLRFEQRCGGGSAALHGVVHWNVGG